jgi:hypothetical protein
MMVAPRACGLVDGRTSAYRVRHYHFEGALLLLLLPPPPLTSGVGGL